MGAALGQTMRVMAVARALQKKGHEVKILVGDQQIPVVKDHCLDVIEMDDLPKIDFPFGALLGTDDGHQDETVIRLNELLQQIKDAEQRAANIVKPDVMLCGSLTGPNTARTLGIPCAMVLLQPGAKTINFTTKQRTTIKLGLNALSAADLIIVEGMPELDGGVRTALEGERAVALGDKMRFTGPLLVEPPENLPGQSELKTRHTGNAELPLVYVTIGGGTPLIGEDFLGLVIDALRKLPGVQGVMSTGLAIDPKRLADGTPPDNVFIRGFVPGTELIKASDVTVFHGGSSTLMTCIACGRPAVVVPSMVEQEDNADVLGNNGAGIVLDKSGLTAVAIAEAIQKILSDRSFLNNAQKLKELGDRYGGAAAAATMVEELVSGGGAH
jgi:UDP:flavonoid glycosyltransferase YjiC (YdhE family)